MPGSDDPLSWVKVPPATIFDPSGESTRASTVSSATGVQLRSSPVAASTAASRLRGWLPTAENQPPK